MTQQQEKDGGMQGNSILWQGDNTLEGCFHLCSEHNFSYVSVMVRFLVIVPSKFMFASLAFSEVEAFDRATAEENVRMELSGNVLLIKSAQSFQCLCGNSINLKHHIPFRRCGNISDDLLVYAVKSEVDISGQNLEHNFCPNDVSYSSANYCGLGICEHGWKGEFCNVGEIKTVADNTVGLKIGLIFFFVVSTLLSIVLLSLIAYISYKTINKRRSRLKTNIHDRQPSGKQLHMNSFNLVTTIVVSNKMHIPTANTLNIVKATY
ncbi:hypothetical protein HELRODRAFT_168191 [Helobdella robusta]|uniref:Uncharacterized protein n=1 Tax=Helobdella robusta TaxID=6412 RepID=T1F0A0_HELRO|nr:hypothetical protein HELRODRAFT_168191 [Helobdella robusta]ESO09229.1 hypothetical protein HELRODRAFT_168191 [Helobdella robusta]